MNARPKRGNIPFPHPCTAADPHSYQVPATSSLLPPLPPLGVPYAPQSGTQDRRVRTRFLSLLPDAALEPRISAWVTHGLGLQLARAPRVASLHIHDRACNVSYTAAMDVT
jgi:hypothetical protein